MKDASARRADRWAVVGLGLLLAGVLAIVTAQWSSRGLLPTGSPAPTFSLNRVDGGTVSLEELRGKVVVLNFWATWCDPCREELPTLLQVAQEYAAREVVLVAASQDDLDDKTVQRRTVGAFLATELPRLAPFAAYSTPEVAASYGVQALPTLYVIDRFGRIASAHRGVTSERRVRRDLEEAIRSPEP